MPIDGIDLDLFNVEWFEEQARIDQQLNLANVLGREARNPQPQPRRRPNNAPRWYVDGGGLFAPAPPPPPAAPPEYVRYAPSENYAMTSRPFYMPYETLDELNLRLVGSVITLHGAAVVIVDVGMMNDGSFKLCFRPSHRGNIMEHPYKEGSGFDLSPFKARYIQSNGYAMWTYRQPVRGCYKQGMCSKNTFGEMAGKPPGARQRQPASQDTFMTSFNTPEKLVSVDDAIEQLRIIGHGNYSIALSHHLALYFSDKNYQIEYKGNPIGTLNEREITSGKKGLKSLIANTPELTANLWAIRRLQMVGIQLG